MQSLRRTAMRSALTATRAFTPKVQAASFLTRLSQSSVLRVTPLSAVRAFSQSVRRAEAESSATPNSDQRGLDFAKAVFVRNISFDMTEEQMAELFSKAGTIVRLDVARDARGMSRGYGFVNFETEEAAMRAVEELDGSFWQGRRLQVQPRRPKITTQVRQPLEPSRTLFVGNMPYETSDADLNRIFANVQNIRSVRVAVDRATGWPRGFAHIEFTDVESCVAAKEKMEGTMLDNRQLRLDFAAETSTRSAPGPYNPSSSRDSDE